LVVQKLSKGGVAGHVGIFGRQHQGEGGVGVDAGPDRIVGLGQEILEPLDEGAGQRRVARGPGPIGVPHQFGLQHQVPGPAIGALEASAFGPSQIGDLGGDLVLGEGVVEQGDDGLGLVHLGAGAQQGGQQPVAVDAGVPVEAAEEDRVQVARRTARPRRFPSRGPACWDIRGHMAQRDLGEPRGRGFSQAQARWGVRP
jgi:hypothetical protein